MQANKESTRDCVTQLILSTLANIAHVKCSRLRESVLLHSLLQFSRRLQHILFCQHPCTPVHTKGILAFGVLENVYCIVRIGVHGTHQPSRVVCADGDEAEVEWTS